MRTCTTAAVLAGLLLLAACGDPYGRTLRFGKGTLYYKEPVTEDQARQVGEALRQWGIFDDRTDRDGQLVHEAGTFRLRFVVLRENVNSTVEEGFRGMARTFGELLGGPFEVDLCDRLFEPWRTL